MKNIKNTALIKTYYLNCKNNQKATQQNDTIRFDSFTLWPHCTFMSAMCYSFWKAQLLQEEGLKSHRKLCILVDECKMDFQIQEMQMNLYFQLQSKIIKTNALWFGVLVSLKTIVMMLLT